MRKSLLIAFLFSVVIVLIHGCSDNGTNSNQSLIQVSGEVVATGCSGICPWGLCASEPRYTVGSGYSATVTLRRDDGRIYSAVTDSLSRIRFQIDTGTYVVTVTTFHTPPTERGELHAVKDTSGLQFRTRIFFDPPDTVTASYTYWAPDKPLSESEERRYLEAFNRRLGGVLNFSALHREIYAYGDLYSVVYTDIAVREGIPSWKIGDRFAALVEQDSTLFPDQLWVSPIARPCFSR